MTDKMLLRRVGRQGSHSQEGANCKPLRSRHVLAAFRAGRPRHKVRALLNIGLERKGGRDLRHSRDARQWTDGPGALHGGRFRGSGAALRGAADGGQDGAPPCRRGASGVEHLPALLPDGPAGGLPVRARQRQMARGAAPGALPRSRSCPPASRPADRAARYVSARRSSIVSLGPGRSHGRSRSSCLRARRSKPPPPALARVNEA